MEELDDLMDAFFFLICAYKKYKLKIKKRRKKRRWHIRPINLVRLNQHHQSLFNSMEMIDDKQFFKYVRMNEQLFNNILSKVTLKLRKKVIAQTVSPKMRLALTLHYLAQGGSMQQVAWQYHVGKTTVSVIVRETCAALWDELAPTYVKCPSTVEEWKKIALDFEQIWNLPNCVGAIDGKSITIQAPNKSGTMYFNYEKLISIVLLAICDANYIFTMVNIESYGSHNDPSIVNYSEFANNLESGKMNLPPPASLPQSEITVPYYFVGDSAFPLKTYLMRPYPGSHLPFKQDIFNYRLSRARRTIENSFGILASRWRVLRNAIIADVKLTELIVATCICLHNYLRMSDLTNCKSEQMYAPCTFLEEVEQQLIHGKRHDITRFGSNNSTLPAKEMRDTLANYLSNAGAVPWQSNIIFAGSNLH